jgi:hypothetical protein
VERRREMAWGDWADGTDSEVVNALRRRWRDDFESPAPVSIPAERWKSWLEEVGMGKVFPEEAVHAGLLTQADLRRLAREAAEETIPQAWIRLFVVTMMWGIGTKNARMKHHLLESIQAVSEDPALLTEGAALIRSGDLAAAYDRCRIPGVGEPFRTKWFFACGLSGRRLPRPLILDGNVWTALWELGWDSRRAAEPRCTTRRSRRWLAYLHSAHRWAHALGKKPGDIEQALFNMGAGVPRGERKTPSTRGPRPCT